MKLPKRSQTDIFKKYRKYASKLYGPGFNFKQFDRFFAKLRKCAISTCYHNKATNYALCHQHHDMYHKNKNKSDTLTDPEKLVVL